MVGMFVMCDEIRSTAAPTDGVATIAQHKGGLI